MRDKINDDHQSNRSNDPIFALFFQKKRGYPEDDG
jgi:hypothetical protein